MSTTFAGGMGHCFGGQGCDTFDKLGVIEGWVVQGQVPTRIIAVKIDAGTVVRTRPLCAYPAVVLFVGRSAWMMRRASPARRAKRPIHTRVTTLVTTGRVQRMNRALKEADVD